MRAGRRRSLAAWCGGIPRALPARAAPARVPSRVPARRRTRRRRRSSARAGSRLRLRDSRHAGVILAAAAPLRLFGNALEIELDGEPVGVLDEHLVEVEFGKVTPPRRAAGVLEPLGNRPGIGSEERA